MPTSEFNVGYGEGTIKHEFFRIKDGVTTFECRELVSAMTNGAEEICLFKAVFGPREEHGKHLHSTCDDQSRSNIAVAKGTSVNGTRSSEG
jgi:hypothetical protein